MQTKEVIVHFKTPDAIHQALKDVPIEERAECVAKLERFFAFGENAVIIVDLENDTARLRPWYEKIKSDTVIVNGQEKTVIKENDTIIGSQG